MSPGTGATTAQARLLSTVNPSKAKLRYQCIRVLRIAISVATLIVCLAFAAAFFTSSGAVDPQVVLDSPFAFLFTSIVTPVTGLTQRALHFRTIYEGWNFLFIGLAGIGFVVRQRIMIEADKLERWAKSQAVPRTGVKGAAVNLQELAPPTSSRMNMLRDYTEARTFLSREKRPLSFLSIDVVGSTKMKAGEDKLVIEHAFAEYKKFVTRILESHNIWKVAWTPDGIMCAFHLLPDAVGAAQDVLSELSWFNQGSHHLKTGFNVRCGINAGEVVFPAEKAMEEVSDEVIDVAGHMQKYAAHGALWLPTALLSEMPGDTSFKELPEQKVDGHPVSEWRAAAEQKDESAVAG